MNVTTEEFNDIYTNRIIPNTVTLALIVTIGTLGNTFAFFMYIFRVPQTEERFFIPILVIVDLLVCLIGGLTSITLNIYPTNFPSAMLCKVMYYLTWSLIHFSASILLIIALHRYKKICRPTTKQWTQRERRIALGVVGVISFLVIFPILFLFGEKKGNLIYAGYNVTILTCNIQRFTRYGSFIYFGYIIVHFIILMIIIIVLYSLIGVTIFRNFRIIRTKQTVIYSVDNEDQGVKLRSSLERSVNLNLKYVRQNHKELQQRNHVRKQVRQNFTGMFAAIIIFWVMAYLPSIILIIFPSIRNSLEFWFIMPKTTTNILLFFKRAFLLNHVMNPFIYGYFDVGFRQEATRLLTVRKIPDESS